MEYQYEAYEMFQMMIAEIQEEVVRYVYHVSLVERPTERENLVENRYQEPKTSGQRRVNKVGRNQPCPCGSGKKYKRCCGA